MPLSQISEFVSMGSDVVVALAALIAAIVAFRGVKQWRKELTGKAKFEIARKMALLGFQFQERFRQARGPITFAGESAERIKSEDETPQERVALDEHFARQARLRPLGEILEELRSVNWEAKIILRQDFQEEIKPLEKSFRELFATVQSYFSIQLRSGKRSSTDLNRRSDEKWMESLHNIIYARPDDELSATVDNAVSELTGDLSKHLR